MFRDAGVAEWQTHLTQNQAGNTVWVQVPPPAPTLGGKTFVLPPIFVRRIGMTKPPVKLGVGKNS